MNKLIFVLFLLVCNNSYSQNGYSIHYSFTFFKPVLNITVQGVIKDVPNDFVATDRLVFNDSFSFYYRIIDGKDPLRKKIVFDKVMHHAVLYSRPDSRLYDEVAWPPGKGKYLVYDTAKNENWIFGDDTKEISGYTCNQALLVNERNDSTLVWYTTEIKVPFGPGLYAGFPGLVLEVYDQKGHTHWLAAKIEKGNYNVVIPEKAIICSRKEYLEKSGGTGRKILGQ